MLAHVSIQCANFEESARFYDNVLTPLGGGRVMEVEGPAIGYGIPPVATFWIGQQQTGDGFRETHIAFTAPTRAAVRAFHAAATQAGAEILHEPKLWPEYLASYFAVFVRDPDGNNIEAVCFNAE
jgi:catechol 2,3-dioxygenase-like lactoylglutathione lyase family enzyme